MAVARPPGPAPLARPRAEGATGLRINWQLAVSVCCLVAVLGLYPTLRGGGTGGGLPGSRLRQDPLLVTPAAGVPENVAAAAQEAAAEAAAAEPAPGETALTDADPAAGAAAGGGGGGHSLPSSAAELRWFRPTGYELPQECYKHEDLYAMVFDNLRPWFARGITKADLDVCAPIAEGDASKYENGTPNGQQFRLLLHGNQVLITSGGLRRNNGGHAQEGLEYYQISQIQDAARRFGLPDMEFAVGFGDISRIRGEDNGGLCPLLIYCKTPSHYDILIPDGQFTQYLFDEWVQKNREDEGGPKWEEKEAKAVGRWHEYCADAPQRDRSGKAVACIRRAYKNHTRDKGDEYTAFTDEALSLSDQRRWKYSLHLDGLGCSNRLQKIMATGQTILKQDSNLQEFFYGALKPWVHYVPTGYNGVEEIDWTVQFLRSNDDLARAIGQNARQFASTHLVEEGRSCYIKVLFEEMKKLMRFESNPGDFPHKISYDEEVEKHVVMETSHMGKGPTI